MLQNSVQLRQIMKRTGTCTFMSSRRSLSLIRFLMELIKFQVWKKIRVTNKREWLKIFNNRFMSNFVGPWESISGWHAIPPAIFNCQELGIVLRSIVMNLRSCMSRFISSSFYILFLCRRWMNIRVCPLLWSQVSFQNSQQISMKLGSELFIYTPSFSHLLTRCFDV